ncbi:MAG: hypothetical protein ACI4ET_06875 [Bilifractor sp.]
MAENTVQRNEDIVPKEHRKFLRDLRNYCPEKEAKAIIDDINESLKNGYLKPTENIKNELILRNDLMHIMGHEYLAYLEYLKGKKWNLSYRELENLYDLYVEAYCQAVGDELNKLMYEYKSERKNGAFFDPSKKKGFIEYFQGRVSSIMSNNWTKEKNHQINEGATLIEDYVNTQDTGNKKIKTDSPGWNGKENPLLTQKGKPRKDIKREVYANNNIADSVEDRDYTDKLWVLLALYQQEILTKLYHTNQQYKNSHQYKKYRRYSTFYTGGMVDYIKNYGLDQLVGKHSSEVWHSLYEDFLKFVYENQPMSLEEAFYNFLKTKASIFPEVQDKAERLETPFSQKLYAIFLNVSASQIRGYMKKYKESIETEVISPYMGECRG